ncbi:MAG: 2-C-methyl-D-erythritol 4-phosphate cytidylyltransferase [Lachnospiraceae bacterium]|nr:2-C-methyl-D-erythritol 4-phosphate cytidylyltransferase [Lachnospiraceae bacterium]
MNIAIVLAAGAGKRMQSNVAKQYMQLGEKPVIWYALQAFEESGLIDAVILVVGQGEIDYCQEHIVEKFGFLKVKAVVEGGAERYLSVWKGLHCARKLLGTEEDYVFIHDGARPFVSEQMIHDTYEAAKEFGACVAGMPVKDTIKIADAEGFATQTPNRKTVWAVQTPQVFEKKLIIQAYDALMEQLEELKNRGIEITDDAMVVETMTQRKVKLVAASYENIKITTPEDMKIAESLLNGQA